MKWKTVADKELEIENQVKEEWRIMRESECFSVINRGPIWYDELTNAQKSELKAWYKEWLKVTDTLAKPTKPSWL